MSDYLEPAPRSLPIGNMMLSTRAIDYTIENIMEHGIKIAGEIYDRLEQLALIIDILNQATRSRARTCLPAIPTPPILPQSLSSSTYIPQPKQWVSALDPAVRPEHAALEPCYPFEELRFADPVKVMGMLMDWMKRIRVDQNTETLDYYFTFWLDVQDDEWDVHAKVKVQMLMGASEVEKQAMFLAGDWRWQRRAICCILAQKLVQQSRDVTVLEFRRHV